MTKLFLAAFLFAALQCCAQNVQMEYKSLDLATGGFREITLRLGKNGRVELIDSAAVLAGEARSGGIYQWQTKVLAKGSWEMKNELVNCTFFDKPKQFLDTLFVLKKPRTKSLSVRGNEIIFGSAPDTLFIDGIPCIKSVHKK